MQHVQPIAHDFGDDHLHPEALELQAVGSPVCRGLAGKVRIVVGEHDHLADAGRRLEALNALGTDTGPDRHLEQLEGSQGRLDPFGDAQHLGSGRQADGCPKERQNPA